MKARFCSLAVALGAVALAASASPAFGQGFSLELNPPSTPIVVGKPLVLKATGTIPVDQLEYPHWFSLDAHPPSVTSTCPRDRWESAQIAIATGGTRVVVSQREWPDAGGNFTVPIGLTPTSAGSVLLCGYTDDGMTNTLGGAALMIQIQEQQKTASDDRPSPAQEAYGGIKSCKALLDNPKSCIRRTIRHAKSQCRKLRSKRRKASCLRSVDRAVKRA